MATSVKIIKKEDTISERMQALRQKFPELPFLIIERASKGIKSWGRGIGVFTPGSPGNRQRVQSGNILAGITGRTYGASYSYRLKRRRSWSVSTISARLANILESKYPTKFPIIRTLERVLPQEGLLERVAYSVMNELVKREGLA